MTAFRASLLLGAFVVLLIFWGVTHQPKTPSAAASRTPTTVQSAKPIGKDDSWNTLQKQLADFRRRQTDSDSYQRSGETPSEIFPRAIALQTPSSLDVASATPSSEIVKIPKGDFLNVRAGAGSNYPVVTKLEPGTSGIALGVNHVANGETVWQEKTVHEQTGWFIPKWPLGIIWGRESAPTFFAGDQAWTLGCEYPTCSNFHAAPQHHRNEVTLLLDVWVSPPGRSDFGTKAIGPQVSLGWRW